MGSQGFEMREANEEYLTTNEKRSRVIGLSEAELRRCRRLFRVFDKDHDGAIDYKELMALLKSIGCPATKETAISMIEDLDGDGNGHVEYHEFLEIMVNDSPEERNEAWQAVIDTLCQDPDFNKRRDEARHHVKNALHINRLRPESKTRCFLDACVALSITYFYVVVLLEDVRKVDYGYESTWKILLEICASLIFSFDALFVMNTAVTHELGGRLLTDRGSILRNYYQTRHVFIDIASTFPYDLIVPEFYTSRLLRHMRLWKMMRLSSLFFIENTGLMSPRYVVFYFRVVPLFLNAIYTAFVLHALAIVWITLHDQTYSYLDAVYYILYTLTTVGYGDIRVGNGYIKVYACFLLIAGACLNGLCIGYLTAFIMRSDITGDKVDKMRQTLAVLRHFRVPSSLQEEILSYQYHVLDHNLGAAYTDVIAGLPPAMQQQVSLYMRVRLVNQVPMFSACELSVQMALAQSLKNIVMPPEEYIMVAGEEGNEMFFLSHGFCDVIAANGKLLATITKGGFFGEVALLVETERHTNVKALTFCDLFILERTEFNLILDRFPSFASHIHDEIDRQGSHADDSAGCGAKTETQALLALGDVPDISFDCESDSDKACSEVLNQSIGSGAGGVKSGEGEEDLTEDPKETPSTAVCFPGRKQSGAQIVDVMSRLRLIGAKPERGSVVADSVGLNPLVFATGDSINNDPSQSVMRSKSRSIDDTGSIASRKRRDDEEDEEDPMTFSTYKSFKRNPLGRSMSFHANGLQRNSSTRSLKETSGGGNERMLRSVYESQQVTKYSVDTMQTEMRELRQMFERQAHLQQERFAALHRLLAPDIPPPVFEEDPLGFADVLGRGSIATSVDDGGRKRLTRFGKDKPKAKVIIEDPQQASSRSDIADVIDDAPFVQSQCGTPARYTSTSVSTATFGESTQTGI